MVAELFYDDDWHEAPCYTRSSVSTSRGLADESQEPTPSRASLTLDNRDKTYSPNYPKSPLKGKVGRNTPGRVSVDDSVRLAFEVADWKQGRSLEPVDLVTKRGDAWTTIDGGGILRRLGRGKNPLRSAAYRALVAEAPVVYWPCEDASGATQLATHTVGASPMTITGSIFIAGDSALAGSEPLVVTTDTTFLTGVIPAYEAPATQAWTMTWIVKIPEEPAGTREIIAVHTPAGTIKRWVLALVPGSPATLDLRGYDSSGTDQVSSGDITFLNEDGDENYASQVAIRLTVEQNGSDIDWAYEYTTHSTGTTGRSGTVTSSTLASANLVNAPGTVGFGGVTYGHFAFISDASSFSTADVINLGSGWDGETARARILRLCAEEDITLTLSGNASDVHTMGPQPVDTLVEILKECARTDAGLLYESRTTVGLTYKTGRSLYNQSSVLGLDYSAGHIAHPLEPTIGDQGTRNDVVAKKRNGSSARAILTTGPMSIQDPPDGVGRTDTQLDVNPEEDGTLIHCAWWHVHKGTADETRYRTITVDLDANPQLVDEVNAVDIGHVITVANLPIDEYQGVAAEMVIAIAESIGSHRRLVTFTTIPASTYEVEEVETSGSTIAVDITASSTSLKVGTSLGREYITGNALNLRPFHVQIGGDAMKVTAVTTETITFVGAGAGTSAQNAAGVTTLSPAFHASTAADDLVVVIGTIRNSGTGTVDTPSGWTLLSPTPITNAAIFGKHVTAAEVAAGSVTISFTGGVANATITAGTATWRNASLYHAGGITNRPTAKVTPIGAAQLNGSAQDIAYPALYVVRDGSVVIAAGWKQDDYTSVAALSGFAEIDEQSETGGDDASHIWDYVIQTTAANIVAGSFTVTGGASAISRGFVIALRPLQTFTVTRDVNGVATSHSAGDSITGWRLGVNGL